MIPRIIPTPKKSEDVVKTCVSLKKHTGKKDGRNFTKTWFSQLEHSKFCEKSEIVLSENIILLDQLT